MPQAPRHFRGFGPYVQYSYPAMAKNGSEAVAEDEAEAARRWWKSVTFEATEVFGHIGYSKGKISEAKKMKIEVTKR